METTPVRALLIHPDDDVAVVTDDVTKGSRVAAESSAGTVEIVATADIPAGHKIAVRAVAEGVPVRKYSEKIGLALADIAVGDHVHLHNLASDRVKPK